MSYYQSIFNLTEFQAEDLPVDNATIIVNSDGELEVNLVPFSKITNIISSNPVFNRVYTNQTGPSGDPMELVSYYNLYDSLTGIDNRYLKTDGSNAMTGTLNMSDNYISSVRAGTGPSDAINISQLDSSMTGIYDYTKSSLTGIYDYTNSKIASITGYISGFLPLSGGTMSGSINMNSSFINNLPSPVNPQDAVPKSYVDGSFSTGTFLRVDGTNSMAGTLDMGGGTNYITNSYLYDAIHPFGPSSGNCHYGYDTLEQLANIDHQYNVQYPYSHVFENGGFTTLSIKGDTSGEYLDMNSNRIRNMGWGTGLLDAVNVSQLNSIASGITGALGNYLPLSGGTMSGNISLGGSTNHVLDSYRYLATSPLGFSDGDISYEYRGIYRNNNQDIIYQVPDTYAHVFQGQGGSTQVIGRFNCNISLAQVYLDMNSNRIINLGTSPASNDMAINMDYLYSSATGPFLRQDSTNKMTGRDITFSSTSFSSGDSNRINYYNDGFWGQGIYLDGSQYQINTYCGSSGEFVWNKSGMTGTELLKLTNNGELYIYPSTTSANSINIKSQASGRGQIRLEDSSSNELWRIGKTSASDSNFNFYDGTSNILSLDRDSNQLLAISGSSTGPAYSFSSDTDSGIFYNTTTGRIGASIGGSQVLEIRNTGIQSQNVSGSSNPAIVLIGHSTASASLVQRCVNGSGGNALDLRANNVTLEWCLNNGTTNQSFNVNNGTSYKNTPGNNVWSIPSDIRIKQDIEEADLDICYDNVKAMSLKRYKIDPLKYPDNVNIDRHQLGFIAQEVEEVYPKSIETMSVSFQDGSVIEDFKTLSTSQIYYSLFGAVQKLMEKVEYLESLVI